MLSNSKVLDYIKQNLQVPFAFLEKTDAEVLQYVQEYVLKTQFSRYIPDVKTLPIDLVDDLVEDSAGTKFYIKDPDNMTIVTIKDVIHSANSRIIMGHPVIGTYTFSSVENFIVQSHEANMTAFFSPYNYTYEFIHPNIIRISPANPVQFTVIYEREHPGFHTIPAQWEYYFLELALAEMMIMVGSIRSRFSEVGTPFGNINLNGADMYSRGTEKKNSVIEILTQLHPNQILDLI